MTFSLFNKFNNNAKTLIVNNERKNNDNNTFDDDTNQDENDFMFQLLGSNLRKALGFEDSVEEKQRKQSRSPENILPPLLPSSSHNNGSHPPGQIQRARSLPTTNPQHNFSPSGLTNRTTGFNGQQHLNLSKMTSNQNAFNQILGLPPQNTTGMMSLLQKTNVSHPPNNGRRSNLNSGQSMPSSNFSKIHSSSSQKSNNTPNSQNTNISNTLSRPMSTLVLPPNLNHNNNSTNNIDKIPHLSLSSSSSSSAVNNNKSIVNTNLSNISTPFSTMFYSNSSSSSTKNNSVSRNNIINQKSNSSYNSNPATSSSKTSSTFFTNLNSSNTTQNQNFSKNNKSPLLTPFNKPSHLLPPLLPPKLSSSNNNINDNYSSKTNNTNASSSSSSIMHPQTKNPNFPTLLGTPTIFSHKFQSNNGKQQFFNKIPSPIIRPILQPYNQILPNRPQILGHNNNSNKNTNSINGTNNNSSVPYLPQQRKKMSSSPYQSPQAPQQTRVSSDDMKLVSSQDFINQSHEREYLETIENILEKFQKYPNPNVWVAQKALLSNILKKNCVSKSKLEQKLSYMKLHNKSKNDEILVKFLETIIILKDNFIIKDIAENLDFNCDQTLMNISSGIDFNGLYFFKNGEFLQRSYRRLNGKPERRFRIGKYMKTNNEVMLITYLHENSHKATQTRDIGRIHKNTIQVYDVVYTLQCFDISLQAKNFMISKNKKLEKKLKTNE